MLTTKTKYNLVFLILILILPALSFAQEKSIILGPDEISVNEIFTITITVQNEKLNSYGAFPEIPGFIKRGTSSSSSTNFVNGQMSSSQSIVQNYIALGEGSVTIPAFSMKINGETIQSPGKTVKVGPAAPQAQQGNDPFDYDPFEDFFGRRGPQEYVNVEDDAFFSLTTSKDVVYQGEGFTVTLAFYVAEANRAQLQFYEVGQQLTDILKKIRPANSWEENFNIESINREPVTINNKRYSQYKIYQATYYPLNLESIKFPSVGLKLVKFKEAKNPTFFGRNRKEDFKTFYTQAKTVKVKELPPHPLKNQVFVGNYELSESINTEELKTGESFTLKFTVKGTGNISAIEEPEVKRDKNFDFYDPNVQQNIVRASNRVRGSKSFSYYGIPKEPGTYDLKNYFNWIYFNPSIEKYDTLSSSIIVNVSGESKRNEYISSNHPGGFYDQIAMEDNALSSRHKPDLMKIFANAFILIMLVLTGLVVFKK